MSFEMFDVVDVPVVIIDRDGRLVRANRACTETLRAPATPLDGTFFWQSLCHDAARRGDVELAIRRIVSTGEPLGEVEAPVEQPNGERLLMLWRVRRANDDVFVATGTDVTARRHGEEARAWAERIVAASEDAIVSSTPTGIIHTWNPAAERIFGYTAEEAIGQPGSIIYPEGDTTDRANVVARMRRGEIVTEHDTLRRRKDGTVFPMTVTGALIRGNDGEVLGVLGIGRDITEIKRSREAEAWLGSILSSSNDAIIGTDLDGVIRSWNPAAERIFGYAAGEIIGRSGELLCPADRRPERAGLLAGLREGRARTVDTIRMRKDGAEVAVRLTTMPLLDAKGKVTGTLTIVNDLTEQRRAEHERVQHQRALQALSTPVVRLWHRILLLPIVGDVDDVRSDQITDTVLRRVESEQAKVVIIDVAGLPVMGTYVASMLLRTARALRLIGAETVLTGIGAQASRTMVRLGVELQDIITKNLLADGVETALAMMGKGVGGARP